MTYALTIIDAKRLLKIYDHVDKDQILIALAMGKYGQSTRVKALKLGSPFTFVAYDENSVTAPGQLTLKQMRNKINKL